MGKHTAGREHKPRRITQPKHCAGVCCTAAGGFHYVPTSALKARR